MRLHPTGCRPFSARALALAAASVAFVFGGPTPAAAQAPSKPAPGGGQFERIAGEFQKRLDASTRALADLRLKIREEQIPLTEELRRLEEELVEARRAYDQVLRVRDGRSLDLGNLKAQNKRLQDQSAYLLNLLEEYTRNFETRIHIAEAQRYAQAIESAKAAAENPNLAPVEKFRAQAGIVRLSAERLREAAGGTVFDGTAVDENGVLLKGKFVVLGPTAFFAGEAPGQQGLADLRLGSAEPALIRLPSGKETGIRTVATTGRGELPIDSTRGNALKIARTKETLLEHIRKGGPVMIPIVSLATAAFLIGLYKWVRMSFIQRADFRQLDRILHLVTEGKKQEAVAVARRIRGPIGDLLAAGVEHHRDPPDMIEEVMFEKVLHARTRLMSLLPFINITAAAAPLFGLLGTVTGMINTFKLITVFGTGDAQTFSSGIAEALITTEWGLIVAIPSLLLSAFLSRKAKAILDDMEKLSIAFINHLKIAGRGDRLPGDSGSAGGEPAGSGPSAGVPRPVAPAGAAPSPA